MSTGKQRVRSAPDIDLDRVVWDPAYRAHVLADIKRVRGDRTTDGIAKRKPSLLVAIDG